MLYISLGTTPVEGEILIDRGKVMYFYLDVRLCFFRCRFMCLNFDGALVKQYVEGNTRDGWMGFLHVFRADSHAFLS